MVADTADRGGDLEQFRSAGRILFTMGLVKGAEGNLSTFDVLSADRILFTTTSLDALTGEETAPLAPRPKGAAEPGVEQPSAAEPEAEPSTAPAEAAEAEAEAEADAEDAPDDASEEDGS